MKDEVPESKSVSRGHASLHPTLHLLLRQLRSTSGNLADEPICTDEHEALERLGGVTGLFLIRVETSKIPSFRWQSAQLPKRIIRNAEPIVKNLKERIESARASALPRSALGKACDYALGRWGQLRRFLDYGQLELSNNLAENAIRPVAIGRRSWLHFGRERAGPRVAAILSVVETCRRHQIPIRQYLSSVLPGLAEFPANRVSELTPANWSRRRS